MLVVLLRYLARSNVPLHNFLVRTPGKKLILTRSIGMESDSVRHL